MQINSFEVKIPSQVFNLPTSTNESMNDIFYEPMGTKGQVENSSHCFALSNINITNLLYFLLEYNCINMLVIYELLET